MLADRAVALQRHVWYASYPTFYPYLVADQTTITAIKSIIGNDASVSQQLEPAFQKYNEEQFTTVKLPGASQPVRRSQGEVKDMQGDVLMLWLGHCQLVQLIRRRPLLRCREPELLRIRPQHTGTQYRISPRTMMSNKLQKASAVQSHSVESPQSDLVKSIIKSLSSHAAEHYPSSSYAAYPLDNESSIAIVLVANKYSPNNFW